MAMVRKNIALKRATKFGLVMDILYPVLAGFVLWNTSQSELFKSENRDPTSSDYL